jgi:site-specific DNA-methyltransferase (adenine-specific)
MYRPGASTKAGRFRDGYGVHSDALPQDEYDDWQRGVLAALLVGDRRRRRDLLQPPPARRARLVRLPLGLDFGLPLRQIITWDRGTGIDVTLRQFCSAYEWVFLFAKPDFKLVDHAASGR